MCSSWPCTTSSKRFVKKRAIRLDGSLFVEIWGYLLRTCVGAAFGRPPSTAKPNNMAQARRTWLERLARTFAAPGPSGPEGVRAATQDLPAERDFLPKGPGKNGVLVPLPPWAKEPAAGAEEQLSYGDVPFCLPKKEPKMPRGLAPRSASAPVANPGPHYGGRIPGNCSAHPARVVQLIAPASAPLPLAGQRGAGRPAGPGKRAWCQQP